MSTKNSSGDETLDKLYSQCFVATASYGDFDAPQVLILRSYRDAVLSHYAAGRAFITTYYKAGPHLADLIRGHTWACAITRLLLSPFVSHAKRRLVTEYPGSLYFASL